VLFTVKGHEITSKTFNIGTFSMFFTFLLIFMWVMGSAFTTDAGITIVAAIRLVVITFALARLYGPYADFYDMESCLISVSAFLEKTQLRRGSY
jgi:hypothetical protein